MPTAKGSIGSWYMVWVTPEQDQAIQQAAIELALKGKIIDERRNRPVMPKEVQGGMTYVPRYAVAKYALSLVVNGHVVNPVKTSKRRKRHAA